MPTDTDKKPAWTPTKVQFLYRHQNRRYYVRTFAAGKEKWTSLKTTLLSVAKNVPQRHHALRDLFDAMRKDGQSGLSLAALAG